MTDLMEKDSSTKTPKDGAKSTVFVAPGHPDSVVTLKARYQNFIGGEWVAPVKGEYTADVSPVNGQAFCEVARSTTAARRI